MSDRPATSALNALNYHHLLYFWTVAREGSIKAAAQALRLSQPSISSQVRLLEDSLGEQLFDRSGRGLELTEMGKVAFRYADQIFSLGAEMTDVLSGRRGQSDAKLLVGVSDLVPKLVLHGLLAPAMHMSPAPQIVCREDKTERLLGELSSHDLDLVLAERPIAGEASVGAFNHLLGDSGMSFFATSSIAERLRGPFPASLDGAPFLAPTTNTLLRRSLERWFANSAVSPSVVAEFEDSALLKAFGREGAGVFPGPTAIEAEICSLYNVVVVGRTTSVRERFYAITVERRLRHPAVQIISDAARDRLFSGDPEGAGDTP